MGLSQYYYLVSSLPDLAMDAQKGVISAAELLDDLESMVEGEDKALVRATRLPFDNANLAALLLDTTSHIFDTRGTLSQSQVQAALKNPDFLEHFYQFQTIMAYKEGKPRIAGLNWEEQLAWSFYEEMCDHSNKFISSWYEFDMTIRNVISAINIRKYGKTSELNSSILLHKNELSSQLLKSTASDFGLSAKLPWIERAIELTDSNIVDYDIFFDLLRWEFLDTSMIQSGFSIEAILAFSFKLAISERWSHLEVQSGKESFESLVSQMEKGFRTAAVPT